MMLCHHLLSIICSHPHEKDFSAEKEKNAGRLDGNVISTFPAYQNIDK